MLILIRKLNQQCNFLFDFIIPIKVMDQVCYYIENGGITTRILAVIDKNYILYRKNKHDEVIIYQYYHDNKYFYFTYSIYTDINDKKCERVMLFDKSSIGKIGSQIFIRDEKILVFMRKLFDVVKKYNIDRSAENANTLIEYFGKAELCAKKLYEFNLEADAAAIDMWQCFNFNMHNKSAV